MDYNLTVKEQKVLTAWAVDAFENCGCWGKELLEDNYSYITAMDLVKATELSTSSVGGILSSLENKGIAYFDDGIDYPMWVVDGGAIENGVLDFLGER